MKKIFNIAMLLAAALAFTGCAGEEDDLFDQSAAERLNAAKVRYTDIFSSSEAGWTMEYYPTGETYPPGDDYELKGRGYLMLVDFNKDGSVKVGMNNLITDNAYEEDTSLWEVIADNGPVLTFSTYNENLHFFSDPAIFETGLGFEGDYEFVIVDAKAENDYAMVKGKKRGTYNLLTKLPEGTDFKTYLDDVNSFQSSLFAEEDTVNYALLHFGDDIMQVRGMGTNIPNIYPYGLDQIAYESYHPGLISKHGDKYVFRLRDSYHMDGFEDVQVFVYDEAADKFVAEEDERVTLTGAVPSEFFRQTFATGKTWTINSSTSKSDSFSELYSKISNEFKNTGATLNSISLKRDGERVALNVTYRTKQSSTATYYFTLNPDKISFSYVEPKNDASRNVLNAVASLNNLITLLQKDFEVAPATNAFKLNSVKLVSGNDWFVLNR